MEKNIGNHMIEKKEHDMDAVYRKYRHVYSYTSD